MKIHLLLLLLTLHSTLSFGQNSSARKVDINRINDYLSQLPFSIKVSISVESISGEKYFAHRPEVTVPAASVIKVPILMELMEKVKAKKIDLNAIHVLKA